MQISMKMSGFTAGESDKGRKAVAKKKIKLMQEVVQHWDDGTDETMEAHWKNGAVRNGFDRSVAESIWDDVLEFASYAFNKSHSAGYAILVMQTAWIKAHYPHEFMAAVLTSYMGKTDKIVHYVSACRHEGIKILPPDINESGKDFTATKEGIRFGFAGIRGVGAGVGEAIMLERQKGGPFANIHDFVDRVDASQAKRNVVEALIKAGAFDSTGYTRMQMMSFVDKNNPQNIIDAEEMIKESGGDADLEEMAKQELKDAKAEKEEYEEKLKILLLPKDPNDDKNIILEIRGAAGGDEAALFAGDLLTMYQKYAEAQGWRFEVMEASMNGVGGFKEVVAMVSGQSVYSKLKYESGAHRVQRVPVTESQGRVHTSTATVLVMPEVEEVEYDIDPKDLRVDIYHASGAGGQNVNKVATAVRIVHLPTNIKVEMQEERTQQKNREKAMKIIRARVADHFAQIAQDEQDAERKSTIGTGDRSERIRTYNFPQNRVTDHRIGLTLQKLDTILSGKLDEVVDALVLYDQTQKLEELNK